MEGSNLMPFYSCSNKLLINTCQMLNNFRNLAILSTISVNNFFAVHVISHPDHFVTSLTAFTGSDLAP